MIKNRKGFSLVEMAIVLIIFGLVLAAASSILTLFVNKGGAERTRKMIEANKNVLYSIAASSGRYDGNTLNSLTYPADAYGINFRVLLDDTLFEFNDGTNDKTNLDYSPICSTDSTIMEVDVCENAVCSSPTNVDNVAIVIISGSANKNIQTNRDSTNRVTVHVQGDNEDDFTGDLGGARVEGYDDIVDWVTLPELRAKAGCDPLKIDFLNTDMPEIEEGGEYDFAIYPKDGIPIDDPAGSSSEQYNFSLISDDDGFTDTTTSTGIQIQVMPAGTVLIDGTENGPISGESLRFVGNAASSLDPSYRVEIEISDDSATVSGGNPNRVTRTLYIIKK